MRRLVLSTALHRGVLGGSRFWTSVGSLAVAVRVLKKLTRNEPEVVYCEALEPGESLVVSHDRRPRVVRGGGR